MRSPLSVTYGTIEMTAIMISCPETVQMKTVKRLLVMRQYWEYGGKFLGQENKGKNVLAIGLR